MTKNRIALVVDRLLSGLLVLAAVTIAAAFAHREFLTSPSFPASISAKPSLESNWQQLQLSGHLVGSETAPVKVIEFGDFECPFCRSTDSIYRRVAKTFGDRVALVFVQDPLSIHRFARPAANAAECAALQGRFAAFHDRLYARQDSLGLKAWTSYAIDAGVADTSAFRECVRSNSAAHFVESGLAAARRLNVHTTPTVLINGWRFPYPPDEAQFDSTISALLNAPGRAKSQ